MSTYHHYAAGAPVVHFKDPVDAAELQTMIDRFLAAHPIPEDLAKTRRIDAILAATRCAGDKMAAAPRRRRAP